MRGAIYSAFALLLLALGGCKQADKIVITDTATKTESPDDREQFPPEPAKPAKPAQPTQLPASYECRDGQCGPSRSFGEQPVRRVFSRLPVLRRFGR